MMLWLSLDPRVSLHDAVDFISSLLTDYDPRGACDQIAERYIGGWIDSKVGKGGFTAFDDFKKLLYPGDPPLHALAETYLANGDAPERIVVYQSAYVAVIQLDGSFRVARID